MNTATNQLHDLSQMTEEEQAKLMKDPNVKLYTYVERMERFN